MEPNEEHNQDQLILSIQTQLRDLHNKQPPEETQKSTAEPLPSLDEVEEIIGYNFRDRSLLAQAFTHGSCRCSTSSYERLEYVGDSVLNLLISREDYFAYPDLQPGKLTRLRAANVDTEKLARVAVKHNLHKYLRHEKPLLDGQVVKSLLEPIITPTTIQMHPVTKVTELCQKHGLKLQFVDLWKETGEIEVFVDDEFVERATYTSKRLIAQNRAANNAYNEIIRKLSAEGNNCDNG
ncbi:hypothetical protein RHMOL_Rhmol06G0229500 [Rhododendron molle]|uniref:Uncharacterized protein n=1 Tax=Rhododendron molle TaxID=49168 RepID=A0ACC0NGQ4_RHOML|nr:hypothetical protein RHMOL_Rhmol06G0229500 [Rhododendron molle]